MTHTITVTTTKPLHSLPKLINLTRDLTFQPVIRIDGIDFFYRYRWLVKQIIDVPMNDIMRPSARLYMTLYSGFQAVECRSNVDIFPFLELHRSKGTYLYNNIDLVIDA